MSSAVLAITPKPVNAKNVSARISGSREQMRLDLGKCRHGKHEQNDYVDTHDKGFCPGHSLRSHKVHQGYGDKKPRTEYRN